MRKIKIITLFIISCALISGTITPIYARPAQGTTASEEEEEPSRASKTEADLEDSKNYGVNTTWTAEKRKAAVEVFASTDWSQFTFLGNGIFTGSVYADVRGDVRLAESILKEIIATDKTWKTGGLGEYIPLALCCMQAELGEELAITGKDGVYQYNPDPYKNFLSEDKNFGVEGRVGSSSDREGPPESNVEFVMKHTSAYNATTVQDKNKQSNAQSANFEENAMQANAEYATAQEQWEDAWATVVRKFKKDPTWENLYRYSGYAYPTFTKTEGGETIIDYDNTDVDARNFYVACGWSVSTFGQGEGSYVNVVNESASPHAPTSVAHVNAGGDVDTGEVSGYPYNYSKKDGVWYVAGPGGKNDILNKEDSARVLFYASCHAFLHKLDYYLAQLPSGRDKTDETAMKIIAQATHFATKNSPDLYVENKSVKSRSTGNTIAESSIGKTDFTIYAFIRQKADPNIEISDVAEEFAATVSPGKTGANDTSFASRAIKNYKIKKGMLTGSAPYLQWMLQKASLGLPYTYGGGHGMVDTGQYDCSGFVSQALMQAGILSSPLTTDAMEHGTAMETAGFVRMKYSGMQSLQPGDVLVYDNGGGHLGHTAVYAGDGKVVESGGSGVAVGGYYEPGWEYVFRYGGK